MTKETKELEEELFELELEATKQEIIDPDSKIDNSLGEVLPTMNVPALPEPPPEEKNIISDEAILGVFDELLNEGRQDRKQIEELLGPMVNMVINDGDATSSSKEAMVNLIKAKTDVLDKMAKVADLMTRIKLKERDTFPRYLAATQNNVTIQSSNPKREILKAIQNEKKKKEKK